MYVNFVRCGEPLHADASNQTAYSLFLIKSMQIRHDWSNINIHLNQSGARAVDFGGPSVYQWGAKFKIKHKSHCFQKSKLVDWGRAKHVNWGDQAPLTPLGAGPDLNIEV